MTQFRLTQILLMTICLLVGLGMAGVQKARAALSPNRLYVTQGISATPIGGTPAATLIQGQQKNISFRLTNTFASQKYFAVKMFLTNPFDPNFTPQTVFEAIVNLNAYGYQSFDRNTNPSLGSTVVTAPGNYVLTLRYNVVNTDNINNLQSVTVNTTRVYYTAPGVNPLSISIIPDQQELTLTNLQMTTGIIAIANPYVAPYTLVQNTGKNINFRLRNLSASYVTKSLRLYIINNNDNSTNVVMEREIAFNPGENKYIDFNYDPNLGGNTGTSPGSYRLELRGLDGNNLGSVTRTSPLVGVISGASNPVNISVLDPVNILTDLKLTYGILAVKHPNSIGNNILEKDREKNISFNLTNVSNVTITRAIKLFTFDSQNNANVVLQEVITIPAYGSISLNRFNYPTLGGVVSSNPGNWRFELRGNNSNNYNTVSISSQLVPVQGGTNPQNYVINPPGPCSYTDLGNQTVEVQNAYAYLCGNGILSPQPCQSGRCGNPDDLIIRQDVAKVLFMSLWGANTDPLTTPAGKFPNLYNDLQTLGNMGQYHAYARVLLYLEYGDQISPFDKGKFNFNPGGFIQRQYFVKALLEAWNIATNLAGPSPFNDVQITDPMYGYLRKAYDLGLTTQNTFRPNDNILRSEAFLMLHRLMANNGNLRPPLATLNNLSSYFLPGNHTLRNLGSVPKLAHGNFSTYEKTSFSISDIKFDLEFGHSYHSYLNELPDEIAYLQPMGKGWNHNYNIYMIKTEESYDDNHNVIAPKKLLVGWPDGSYHVYQDPDGNPTPITLGVYDQVTRINATKYELKSKSQVIYTFEWVNIGPVNIMVLTSIKDRNNNTTTFGYRSGQATVANNVLTVPLVDVVTAPSGRTLGLVYNSDNPNHTVLAQVNAPDGRFIKFSYNSKTYLETFTNPSGKNTLYTYHPTFKGAYLTSIKYPKGNIVINQYNLNKKLYRSQAGVNRFVTSNRSSYSYPNNPEVGASYTSTLTTQNGNNIITSTLQNDYLSRPIHSTSTNNTMIYEYNDVNHPFFPTLLKNTTSNLRVENSYDSMGNILETKSYSTNNNVSVQKYTYNNNNDLTSYTDPMNVVTTYDYQNGNLSNITTPAGVSQFFYNSNGTVDRIINSENIETKFTYDNWGNIIQVEQPAISTVKKSQTGIGGILQWSEDALGRRTTYFYDPNGNLKMELGPPPTNYITRYDYDDNDNLIRITNPKGRVTTLDYDFDTDQLISEKFGPSTKTYTYNQDGTPKTFRRPDNTTLTYIYDNLGRMTADGFVTGIDYNSDNTIWKIRGGNSSELQYAYDEFLRPNSVTHNGQNVGYVYDLAGKVTRVNYPGGKFVTYEYDNANRLYRVRWNGNDLVAEYTYLSDGRLSHVEYGNGSTANYAYDLGGRLTGISNRKSDGSIINEYQSSLNPMGNVTREDITQPLAMQSLPTTSITGNYDDENRITSLTGDVNMIFNVDLNGNTHKKASEIYSYDQDDNILSISAGAFTASYQYDATGARRRAVRSGITTNYVVDPLGANNILVEMDANNVAQSYYVYGLGLVCRIKPNNDVRYYHYDQRGSTIAMTNTNEDITHKYLYDDFGNCLQALENGDLNRFRYVGQHGVMWENGTTYFMRARYYDGSIGRFFSEDPIWHANLYPYADNDPINMIDPMGTIAGKNSCLSTDGVTNLVSVDIKDPNFSIGVSTEASVVDKCTIIYDTEDLISIACINLLGYEASASISPSGASLSATAYLAKAQSITCYQTSVGDFYGEIDVYVGSAGISTDDIQKNGLSLLNGDVDLSYGLNKCDDVRQRVSTNKKKKKNTTTPQKVSSNYGAGTNNINYQKVPTINTTPLILMCVDPSIKIKK